jgi:hypothetical protein
MTLHPDGLYPHTLSPFSVFLGVFLQVIGLAVVLWLVIALLGNWLTRRVARRAMATFRFGQGRRDNRWN